MLKESFDRTTPLIEKKAALIKGARKVTEGDGKRRNVALPFGVTVRDTLTHGLR